MYRIVLLAFAGSMAFAQTKAPAAENPPGVLEQAVRARANEFYGLLVQQKYRQAEAYVAEDTKDYYYAGPKPEIHQFEVLKVEFSDDTHARVITRCIEPIVMAGFPPGNVTVNVPTFWKLENGNWSVYESPDKIRNPSGLRSVPVLPRPAGAALPTEAVPPPPDFRDLPKDAGFVFGKVRADKTEVKLSAGGTETITIMNSSSGPITLEYGYPLGGVEAKLDRTDVAGGGKATLTLTAGKDPRPGSYSLRVLPTGEAIRINVLVR
ncbi:MAG TPA: hypothetical protein VMB03_12790 [Bryobacteraceae bacterium]|nr:hypothetical protein [Bryobacteraceae bacterium]